MWDANWGLGVDAARLEAGQRAGLFGIGISLDGMEALHDRVRGVKGSWAGDPRDGTGEGSGPRRQLQYQIGAETLPDLEPLYHRISAAGATHWQLQITVAWAMPSTMITCCCSYRVLELMPLLNRLYLDGQQRGLLLTFGNNLGYYGPYEHNWRGLGDETQHWTGCAAGQNVIGLEADGTIKGCPSLATDTYGGGNVRDTAVAELWNTSEALHFGRLRDISALWGHCALATTPMYVGGGAPGLPILIRKPGNNPYCHYRALKLEKRGILKRSARSLTRQVGSLPLGASSSTKRRFPDARCCQKHPPAAARGRAYLAEPYPIDAVSGMQRVHLARGGNVPTVRLT